MPMNGVLGDHQPPGDLTIRQPLCEKCQHLLLAPRDRGHPDGAAVANRDLEQPAGTLRLRFGPELEQTIQPGRRLVLGQLRLAQGSEAQGQLDPCPRRLVGSAASLEAVDGVLEHCSRPVMLPGRSLEHSLGQLLRGTQRLGPGEPHDLLQGVECRRAPRRAPLAPRGRGPDARAPGRGRACAHWAPGEAAARPVPPRACASPWSSASRARQSWACASGPARSSRARLVGRACLRLSSARPTRGPPAIAGSRAREVLDGCLQYLLGIPPLPSPEVDGAVLCTAEGKHVAASVALARTPRSGRTTRTRARSRGRRCRR